MTEDTSSAGKPRRRRSRRGRRGRQRAKAEALVIVPPANHADLLRLSLFPFPYKYKDDRRPGSLLDWPRACLDCQNRVCEMRRAPTVEVCPYGYSYVSADADMLVAGVVTSAAQNASVAQGKRIRQHRRQVVPVEAVMGAVEAYRSQTRDFRAEFSAEKERVRREYVDSERFKLDFLEPLRDDILRGLSFVHDYKQINAQISQNINVLIETSYQAQSFELKLAKAKDSEKAIYEASKFLEEKLNVAKFLLNPNWLTQPGDCSVFRFHGLAYKYIRIYEPQFQRKQIKVVVSGDSYKTVHANGQAVGVIPHTLLDNALKYAPRGSRVEVHIEDEEDHVLFSVRSLGPTIQAAEINRIFDPFYRGEAARRTSEEGAGYGLYVSQLVAKEHLGTEITVTQESSTSSADEFYSTEFSVRIPLKAKILF